jgi:hypothetical protein
MKSLTPAYGRDYKSSKEVYAALNKGEEFTLSGCLDGGGYVTQQELVDSGETKVMVRYNKLKTQGVFGLPPK